MIIYLIRHGESVSDVENLYGGAFDDHLTEKGKEEAEELAQRLKDKNIQVIFSSPYFRAEETAEILKSSLGCELQIVDNIKERNSYGFLSGKNKDWAKKEYPEICANLKGYHYTIEEGERYEDFKERVGAAWNEIINSNYERIAVITHGGPIRCLFREMFKFGEFKGGLGDCMIAEIGKTGAGFKLLNLTGSQLENGLEDYLKEKILADLENSRGGFDKIHTLEVVDWLKQIIKQNPELNLDETVLLIAAYAHDWGYSEIFKEGQVMSFELVENAKSSHMELGARKIKKLLEEDFFSFLTNEQKERCVHLVAVHDKKLEIKDTDELILAEADMLSGLDVTDKPMFDAESNKKYMEAFMRDRMPKFITKFSKDKVKKLIQKRQEYYKQK